MAATARTVFSEAGPPPALEREENLCFLSSTFSSRCQDKKKWLWFVLPTSSVSREMILLYGSECFSKHQSAGLVLGAGEGSRLQHRLVSSECEIDREQRESSTARYSCLLKCAHSAQQMTVAQDGRKPSEGRQSPLPLCLPAGCPVQAQPMARIK